MSISESSSRNMLIAASLIALVRTYFCRFLVFSEMPKLTIQGRWSDNWLSIMEDEMDTCFLCGVLQNTWSIRLHECLANLVGNVIFGKKLLVQGANMEPTWGWQDPGGPNVGHMNLAIWDSIHIASVASLQCSGMYFSQEVYVLNKVGKACRYICI